MMPGRTTIVGRSWSRRRNEKPDVKCSSHNTVILPTLGTNDHPKEIVQENFAIVRSVGSDTDPFLKYSVLH